MSIQTSAGLPTRLAELAIAIHATLDGNLPARQRVPRYDDEESLHKHTELRRVVWLSRGGNVVAPRQAGARPAPDGTPVTACKTREEDVEVHIFAESKARTEALLDSIIAATCRTLRVVDIGRYRWETQETTNNGRTLRNQYCVLHLKMGLPVPSEIAELAELEGLEEECGIQRVEDGKIAPSDGGEPYDP